ncbi:MAG: hypothetical protein Q4C49_12810 [Bacillota bacterium]|nr:hypothetical protein [Bacillota bacterium]
MYENVGEKIKVFVSVTTIVPIVIILFAGVISTDGTIFFMCLLVSLGIWGAGLLLVAIGQLVINTEMIIKNQNIIIESFNQKEIEHVEEEEELPEI